MAPPADEDGSSHRAVVAAHLNDHEGRGEQAKGNPPPERGRTEVDEVVEGSVPIGDREDNKPEERATGPSDKEQAPIHEEEGHDVEGEDGGRAEEEGGIEEETARRDTGADEKGKNKEDEGENAEDRGDGPNDEEAKAHPWQAVWDAGRGAWYFWNAKTNETTWTNPLEGSDTNGQAATATASSSSGKEEPAPDAAATTAISDEELAQMHNLDPDLAYLDPGLYASQLAEARQAYVASLGSSSSGYHQGSSSSTSAAAYAARGTFDSRTGKFVPSLKLSQHDPSRLSHANQADRQMGAFFDVEAYHDERRRAREQEQQQQWEEQQASGEAYSRKRKPTKQDLQFYQQRKKERKAAKLSWLRD